MKSNGDCRGRLNARGYKEVDGHNYTSDSITMPVTNPITVRTVRMLWCMNPDRHQLSSMLKELSYRDTLRMATNSIWRYLTVLKDTIQVT